VDYLDQPSLVAINEDIVINMEHVMVMSIVEDSDGNEAVFVKYTDGEKRWYKVEDTDKVKSFIAFIDDARE
jgi:hypothetical protein